MAPVESALRSALAELDDMLNTFRNRLESLEFAEREDQRIREWLNGNR